MSSTKYIAGKYRHWRSFRPFMVMVYLLLYAGLFDASGQFAGGNGTSGDPYQIANVTQLQLAGSYLTSSFVLTNNIDASATSTWNSGSGFVPIGNISNYFRGNFNGAGYKITGLTINRPTTDWIGLFGVQFSGLISNITLENVNIRGREQVGALVGEKLGNTENCSVSGTVTGTKRVGGITGNNHGKVTACNSSCTVTGTDRVGGLIGSGAGTGIIDCFATGNVNGGIEIGGLIGGINSNGGTVQNCYATGNVSTTSTMASLGGFIGRMETGTISNSYATGNVSGGLNIGGFIGHNQGIIEKSYSSGNVVVGAGGTIGGFAGINDRGRINNSYSISNVTKNSLNNSVGFAGGFTGINQRGSTITNAYSAGTVSSNGGPVGGFSGSNEIRISNNLPDSGKIVNSYWDINISGQTVGVPNSSANVVNTKVTGLSTASMRQMASFTAWDFASIWTIDEGTTYPYFRPSPLTTSLFDKNTKTIERIKIHSNKFEQSIQIHGIDVSEGINIEIISIDGKMVFSKKTNSSTIDISTLKNGIYLIELTDKAGQLGVFKFIKN